MCVCHLDAVFVAVGGASRAGTLLFGEDDGVLVEENAPEARSLPARPTAHRELTLPHQLAALRYWDLKTHVIMTLLSVLYKQLQQFHPCL